MDLADERQEEINLLEQKVGYLEANLAKCAEFERDLILKQDEMKARIETDFNTIKKLNEELTQLRGS